MRHESAGRRRHLSAGRHANEFSSAVRPPKMRRSDPALPVWGARVNAVLSREVWDLWCGDRL